MMALLQNSQIKYPDERLVPGRIGFSFLAKRDFAIDNANRKKMGDGLSDFVSNDRWNKQYNTLTLLFQRQLNVPTYVLWRGALRET